MLDKQRQPLGRAILSSDQRSLGIVKQWQAAMMAWQGISEKIQQKTGKIQVIFPNVSHFPLYQAKYQRYQKLVALLSEMAN